LVVVSWEGREAQASDRRFMAMPNDSKATYMS